MRVLSLYLEEFKNLRRFSVDFDQESAFSVAVGRNGTGKSNLLEALVLIFKNLDLKKPPPFAYRICFECRSSVIEVDATEPAPTFRIGPKRDALRVVPKKTFEEVDSSGQRIYLPAHVFGYYSGPSNRLQEHFTEHHQRFYKLLLAGEDAAYLRPLFYSREVHSQFVLLAFFSGLGEDQSEFLREYLGIRALDSVLFVLSEPAWGKGRRYSNYGWFREARGEVRRLLDALHKSALAPLQVPKVRVPVGLAKSEKRDHYYLYLPDPKALAAVAAEYAERGGQKNFFAALESMYISDLVQEVRTVVRIGCGDQTLSFRELSEGEQQLLMVLGLIKFTQQEESLFLLDEPDTHLNPAWSVEYIDLLGRVAGEGHNSHFVITTHDPLVIAGRLKEEVVLLDRDDKGQVFATTPLEDPRGMGVAALLTSEIYGLRSELDLFTLRKLDRKRTISLKDKPTSPELEELGEINEYLSTLDLGATSRDPAQTSWNQLLTSIERDLGIEGASLSRDQSERLKEQIDAFREHIAEEVE